VTPEYLDYVNMIRNEAWKRVRQDPSMEFEDLVSQGNLAFCMALASWDRGKGKFSTYLWWKIRDQMGRKNNPKPEEPIGDLQDCGENAVVGPTPSPDSAASFRAALEGLSSEARTLCLAILDSSGEFCDLTASSVMVTKINVKRYLISLDWSKRKISRVFGEIRSMLANM
jgi:hypothetical protein